MNGSEFFAMGGYGLYVWGSYGVTAVVLVLNVVSARRRLRAVRRHLDDMKKLKGTGTE